MDNTKRAFQVWAASVANTLDCGVPIAASRAGFTGLLDIEYASIMDPAAQGAVARMAQKARGSWGLRLRPGQAVALAQSNDAVLAEMPVAVLVPVAGEDLSAAVTALREMSAAISVAVEVRDAEEALAAEAARADLLVAKGHEAGGTVGDETAFLLVQRLVAAGGLPVLAQGGVSLETAAALRVAGAIGVVLDWQLALTEESSVSGRLAATLARMDGSETYLLGADGARPIRIFSRTQRDVPEALQALDRAGETLAQLPAAVDAAVDLTDPDGSVWLTGQDAAFAAGLARRFGRTGRVLDAIAHAVDAHPKEAARAAALAEGGPLAEVLGTRYPIVQGPMTRVSDRAEFALAVAEGGALPFLALALMRRDEADTLVAETAEMLGDRPWGVGILGFVDEALRAEQMDVIAKRRPKFALIAGGRPEQALGLERDGIPTYLHVPSPGLLKLFLQSGARRFIFEGRECGGHVGPRSSAVLWQQAVDAILDHYGDGRADDLEILFAGGLHDDVSAAMVATLAAPLTAKGVKIGALIGTAYILTEEAVAAGAVLEGYQRLALEAKATRLLESGVGHATRVVESPIVQEFYAEKARMRAEQQDPEHIKDTLEHFNVGRSRIASKGMDRNPEYGKVDGASKLIAVPETEQIERGLYMIGQVASLHDRPMTIEALHADVCTGSQDRLAAFAPQGEVSSPARAVEGPGARIAITGLGTILPGAADLSAYWENILDRVDAIQEVPERRWDWRRYYDADRNAPDKTYSRWGGFLDEIDFDPIRYGIPPNSMPSIEPLQLLALEVVRQALENAGFKDGQIPDPDLRRRTCVIIGVGGGAGPLGQRYAVRSSLPAIDGSMSELAESRLPEWTEDSFPGILLNVIAGRIANRFDLGGVNFTVDAACGSSLAAVMMAAREIENGAADMAIVGGADSFQNPFDFLAFAKTRALSPRGRCRTFDAGADGIAISEGLATMVLRPLDQAERAGDRIYAVLRGVAGASDGRDLSLTAPRAEGQQETLRRAYDRAGISPATVGAVEAHGTGTVVGDRTEIESLSAVFANAREDRQFCGVGSVKSMIGHTKAAAGCAGIAKMALALHHRVLPSTLNVEVPNPTANFPESPFYVMTEARPWLRHGDTPRRAGVSAFGFGGTNFHAVLEEYEGGYLPRHQEPFRRNWGHELFVISAADAGALKEAVTRAAAGLAGLPGHVRMADVAASLAARFDAGAGARLALVAGSLAEAAERLSAVADQIDPAQPDLRQVDVRGAFVSLGQPLTAGEVAFLFPGQGSQYPGMGADLAMTFPALRAAVEEAGRTIADGTPAPLGELIWPRPTLDEAEAAAQAEALKATNVAQPAIGAVSAGMLDILRGLGLTAGQAAGHSFGEYTALHSAGAFDAHTLVRLAFARGDAIVRTGGDDLGAMIAVSAGAGAVRDAVAGVDGITLANLNAPDQTVIAGPTPAIERAAEVLGAAGLSGTRLPVACGFHSECVAPARDLLAGALDEAPVGVPGMPVISNETAAPYPDEADAVKAQLARHLVSPVDFMGGVAAMHERGARLFIEVGPGSVLTRLAGRILGDAPHVAVSTDVKSRGGVQQLLTALAAAAAAGLPLSLGRLFDSRAEPGLDVEGWAVPAPEVSKMLWKVDAANARPAGGAPARRGFAARIEEDPVAAPPAQTPAAAPVATQPPAPTPAPVVAQPAASPETAAVLARHQALMQQFLQSHREVMLSWIGSGAGSAIAPGAATGQVAPMPQIPAMTPPATPAPVAAPAVAAPVVPPVAPAPALATAAVAAASPAAPAIGADAVTASLLSLIAERTGYPPEMLDPKLDLEADLGIDSIKRVEILGELRTQWLKDAGEAAQERMGPVSRERTVDGIIARFMEVVAEFAAPVAAPALATAAVAAAAPAAPAIGADAVTASLLSLIAERTGYPPEMLDPKLDLEADLGIDSIKRVEILGELRTQWLKDAGEAAQERMGPVSRERTVDGIIARFMEVVAEFAAPVAAPALATAAVAAAAPVAPAIGADAVTASLLSLIAERTGYPPEMLDPKLDLEADLGIDSIKRVEILGELRTQWLKDAGEAAQERMGPVSRERTVDGIIARFMEVVAEFAAPVAAPALATAAVAAAAPAAPAIGADAVTASLLSLIAERTGYPPEMLDPKLDLEADLGIDSIKRVEILGELRTQWLKDAGEAAQERMGPVSRERTVDGIIARFMEVVAEFTAPVAAPALSEAGRQDLTDWHGRYVMVPRRVAAPTPKKALVAGLTYAVTGPEGQVGDLLAARIEAAGAAVLRITTLEDAGIRAALAGAETPLGGLFHVWPLTARARQAGMSAGDWEAAVDGDLRTLYSVLNAVGAQLAETPGGFVLSGSNMGGAFGFDGATSGSPSAAGAPGLLKSAAKEWQALHVRAVDLEASLTPEETVAILLDEAGRPGGEVEIGWKGGVRFDLVAELRPMVYDTDMPVEGLGPDDVVLVTGGARGITAKIVRHLAAHHRPRFVLLGSSPLDTDVPGDLPDGADERSIRAHLVAGRKAAGQPLVPAEIEAETRRIVKAREMAETLGAVRASGCEVEYLSADVRDADAFASAIAGVYDRHGRIDVVLHGAGVIEDKLIADKTLESFENVVKTKTGSAFTLTRALRMDTVKCLVFFTSVAGRFGNRGQGDYGAGNEIVSKLARTLDAGVPGRVVAISWGPWDSGGMVTAEIKAQFSRLGIEAIDPANGVAALEVELQKGATGEPEVVWGRGPWEDGRALHREVAE